jgi:hypothetical protein
MLIPKIKFSGCGIFELLLQQPWYSIEHKVRNSIILTFTSSITQLENMLFTSTDCLVMQEWGNGRKPIERRFQKYNFPTGRRKFKFLLQEPWNSIEHKVRNSIILSFTSSITQLEKHAFYLHGLSSYARVRQRQKAYWA